MTIDKTQGFSGSLARFAPAPKFRMSGAFQKVMGAASQVAGGAVGAAAGAVGAVDSQYMEMINKQQALQEQMMLVSMISNTAKTEHDTKMAPVRNLRVA